MRKIMFCIVMTLVFCSGSLAELINQGPYDTPEITSITVDGDLSDWDRASTPLTFAGWFPDGTKLDSTTTAQYAWNDTDNKLYIGIISTEGTGAVLEVGGLSTDGSTTSYGRLAACQYMLTFNPGGSVNTLAMQLAGGPTDNVDVASSVDIDDTLFIEMAITLRTDYNEGTGDIDLIDDMIVWEYADIFSAGWGAGDHQNNDGSIDEMQVYSFNAALNTFATQLKLVTIPATETPVITPPSDVTAVIDQEYSDRPLVQLNALPITSWTKIDPCAAEEPSNFAFDANNGRVTWTPQSGANDLTVKMTVTNALGTSDPCEWIISVLPPAVHHYWNGGAGAGDPNWNNTANWSPTTLPRSDERAYIASTAPTDANVLINGIDAYADIGVVGNSSEVTLTIDGGGSWTISSLCGFGYSVGDTATVNIVDGDLTVRKALWLGRQGTATVNMTSGTLTVVGEGYAAGAFTIGSYATGVGHLQLDGGTVDVRNFDFGDGTGTMDIAGGTLIIDGNQIPLIMGYVDTGLITAYDYRVGDILIDYDQSNADRTTVSAFADFLWAYDPSPEKGAVVPGTEDTLRWSAGDNADSHDVYFGSDRDDVNDATPGTAAGLGVYHTLKSPYDNNSCAIPGTLQLGKEYFWRIDEVNNSTPYKGAIWSFKVVENLILDEFTNYGSVDEFDDRDELVVVWKDGYGDSLGFVPGNNSGAQVWLNPTSIRWDSNIPATYEQNTSHDAARAMTLVYDNDGEASIDVGAPDSWTPPSAYSEIEANAADLPVGTDWTVGQAKILSLWFLGDPNNDTNETMYVALKDGDGARGTFEVRYGDHVDEDMSDLENGDDWQEWFIRLEDFNAAGINLANVDKIYIGFDDSNSTNRGSTTAPYGSGTGIVYLDDIRLYTYRCIPSRAGFIDIIEDCSSDKKDVAKMVEDWLLSDSNTGGLKAHWKFDGDMEDSWVNGNDGTYEGPGGLPIYVAGQDAVNPGALVFDGEHIVDHPIYLNQSKGTVAFWAKAEPNHRSVVYYESDTVNSNGGGSGGMLHEIDISFYGGVDDVNSNWGVCYQDGKGVIDSNQVGDEWIDGNDLQRFKIRQNSGVPGDANWAQADVWTHVALTFDRAGTAHFYIDGNQIGLTIDVSAITFDDRTPIVSHFGYCGVSSLRPERHLIGALADARIYDIALSAANIQRLYNGQEALLSPIEEYAPMPPTVANLSPKVGDEGAYNVNNRDTVNFKDLAALLGNWYAGGETALWPSD